MAIKTPKGYRVLGRIPTESLDLYIKSFTAGSGETILVGKSDTLDLTITRGTRTSDGAGNALQLQGGTATGTNQVGGHVSIYTGYPTGNAAAGDFKVFGALVNGSSGTSVNPSNSTMFSVSGDTGDATFANDIILGGDKFSNEGSNNALNVVADGNMIFSIDRDADTSGNYFSFTKNAPGPGASYGVEVANIDESGNLQIDGSLTVGSTEVINSSGVLQVATQGTIDHDSLANFVAAEHVDWAGASAGTIHSTNIPTLNQDTTGNAATATALETARTIAGVSFDGTANISLNNNAITNGAGYTTNTGDITDVNFRMDDGGNAGGSSGALSLFVSGGEGIDTSASSGTTIIVAGEDASTSNKGIASFSSSNFSVSSGAVSLSTGQDSNVVKQVVITHHHFFMNSSSTTADFFFPYNNLNEASSTSQYYTRTIAPYDGRIIKVLIRPSAAIGTACKLQFHKITDTTLNFGTAVEEVTNVNLNTAETSVSTAFSSATFSAGDVVNVSLIKSSSSTANIQAVIVWEYTT